ncbi:LOW QUALITY PROTEIN: metalloproteinase inhibitor 1-like [Lutra lutra]|uniref:LOW QUALITY PROTEIN: metalloproteinase inhibitor 1-like n=1 Tax=Lutra lutra TaxID=9657 RepID=UPI001FD0E528|nr:LOW QUALITY PROTEIN: metalloproteinase inhibitor 1-like [Lutra lutra]
MDPSFLLAFLLLLALSTPCSACNCKIQHPQTYYCTSDVVILADILGPGKNTRTKRGFRVNVTKVLKAPWGTPRIHEIYTPINWVDCGYGLRTRQQSLLLIAGFLRSGTVFFTRCHLVYFWYRLTREQKLGFEAAYRAGCECEIQPCLICRRDCPQPDFRECVWKQKDCDYKIWEGNHSQYSMCVPSMTGNCEWTAIQKNYQYQTPTPVASLLTQQNDIVGF